MRKWQLTADAFGKLFNAIEIGLSERADFGSRTKALRDARLAVDELAKHVDDSEECEEP